MIIKRRCLLAPSLQTCYRNTNRADISSTTDCLWLVPSTPARDGGLLYQTTMMIEWNWSRSPANPCRRFSSVTDLVRCQGAAGSRKTLPGNPLTWNCTCLTSDQSTSRDQVTCAATTGLGTPAGIGYAYYYCLLRRSSRKHKTYPYYTCIHDKKSSSTQIKTRTMWNQCDKK